MHAYADMHSDLHTNKDTYIQTDTHQFDIHTYRQTGNHTIIQPGTYNKTNHNTDTNTQTYAHAGIVIG